MMENWKPIPGYKDYEVSETGEIRSIDRIKKFKSGRTVSLSGKNKVLRKHPDNGFLMTDLIDDKGVRRTVYPHKVVAQVFVQNSKPRKHKVVIHVDGNVLNNHFTNLQWSSVSDSIKRGFELGIRDNSTLWDKRREKYGPQGGLKPMGRPDPLSDSDKKQIKVLRTKESLTLGQLAARFGCSISHIHKILKF